MFIKQPQSIMSDSILQKYVDAALLNKRVIKDVDDLDSLRKASAQLVKKLRQKNYKSNLIPFILLGINPKIRPDESLLDEVETIIKNKNKLFVSRSKDRSVTIIRAVILHAFEQMAKDDMTISFTIYLTGSKYFEYVVYPNKKEKEVIKRFLFNLGVKVEKHSTDLWKIQPVSFESIDQPDYPKYSIPTNLANGESDTLQSIFDSFDSLENNKTNVRNQYNNSIAVEFLKAESFNKWYNNFNETIPKAITDEISSKINDVRTPLNESLKSLQGNIETYVQALNENINAATESLINGTNSLRKRDRIIWWKETLFSNSIKKSYRDLKNEAVRNIVMARDYSDMLPSGYCPLSVDYFFKETAMKMEVSSDEISFKRILELLEDDKSSAITQIWNSYGKTDKIMPVPEFINGFIHGDYNADEFEKLTYVKLSDKIKLTDLGLWVFHYLQSKHLLK